MQRQAVRWPGGAGGAEWLKGGCLPPSFILASCPSSSVLLPLSCLNISTCRLVKLIPPAPKSTGAQCRLAARRSRMRAHKATTRGLVARTTIAAMPPQPLMPEQRNPVNISMFLCPCSISQPHPAPPGPPPAQRKPWESAGRTDRKPGRISTPHPLPSHSLCRSHAGAPSAASASPTTKRWRQ